MEIGSANKNVMSEKHARSSIKHEDHALLKKVSVDNIAAISNLQMDNPEIINNMYEKNGRAFKAQLNNRMKRGQGIFDHTAVSNFILIL